MAQLFEPAETGGGIVGCKGRQLPSCDLLPEGLDGYSVNEVDGCIYVFGGQYRRAPSGHWQRSNRMFKFNIADGRWSEEVRKNEQRPGGLLYHTGCSHNSSIYFVGGGDENHQPNLDVWIFNCTKKTFKRVEKSLPNPSPFLWRAVIGGSRILAIDGINIWEMDLGIPWKKVAVRPTSGYFASVAFVDGSIHMIEDGGARHQKYDVNKGELQQQKPLEGGRFLRWPSLTRDANRLVALARKDGQGKSRSNVVLFDSSKEEHGWTWITPTDDALMPPAFGYSAATGACSGGRLCILGRIAKDDKRSNQFWEIELTRTQPKDEGLSTKEDPRPVVHTTGCWTDLLDNFRRLLSSGEMSNVKFLVGTEHQVVKGHIVIISSRCPMLASLIKEAKSKMEAAMPNSKLCCRLEVELPQVEASTFERVLHFIYTGYVDEEAKWEIQSEMLLFNAAAFFGLESLQQQCAENLRNSWKVDNLVERLQVASGLSLPFARQFFVKEIVRSKRYCKVVSSPRFCRLPAQVIVEVHRQFGLLHDEELLKDAANEGSLEVPE